jgi:hypothetical protein
MAPLSEIAPPSALTATPSAHLPRRPGRARDVACVFFHTRAAVCGRSGNERGATRVAFRPRALPRPDASDRETAQLRGCRRSVRSLTRWHRGQYRASDSDGSARAAYGARGSVGFDRISPPAAFGREKIIRANKFRLFPLGAAIANCTPSNSQTAASADPDGLGQVAANCGRGSRSRLGVGPPARIWTMPAPKPTTTPICQA